MPTTYNPAFVASFDAASPFAGFVVASASITNDGRNGKAAVLGTLERAVTDGENVAWGVALKLESGNFSTDIRIICTTASGPNLILEQIGDGRMLVKFISDVSNGTKTLGMLNYVFNTVDWFYFEIISTLASTVTTLGGISHVTQTVTAEVRINKNSVFTGGDTYTRDYTAGSEPALTYSRVALRNTGQGYYIDDFYEDTAASSLVPYGDGEAQSNDSDFIIQDADAVVTQAFLESVTPRDNTAYLTQAFLESGMAKENIAYLTQAFLEVFYIPGGKFLPRFVKYTSTA